MSKPITIQGMEFPSYAAAAQHFNVTTGRIAAAKSDGKLDRLGTKPGAGYNCIPTEYKGKKFPSLTALANYVGVKYDVIWRHLDKYGTFDNLEEELKAPGPRNASKPIVLNGVTYPSGNAAAEALGVSRSKISVMRKAMAA